MKKFIKITLNIIVLFAITLYFGVVFVLPKIVNNETIINKVKTQIYNKTGIETNIAGLNLKISPKLVFQLNIDNIDSRYNNVSVFDIKKVYLKYELLQNQLALINAENIYIDRNILKQFRKESKKDKKNFDINKIPEIHIKNLTYKSDEICIYAQNIDTNNDVIKFNADIKTTYINETVKLGNHGTLQIADNKINANNFQIKLGNSQIYLDGMLFDNNKSFDFSLKGRELPVSELMAILLHFQKSQDPTKKFIENFKNYKGTIKLDLKFNNKGIFGKGIANNLGANAVWFDIPIYFNEAVFDFKGKQIMSIAEGKIGKEKAVHKLNITDLGSENKEVVGSVDTTLTNIFNYVPNLTIKNSAIANITYKIKYKKIDVFYNLELNPESDLIYKASYLGLREYKRKIYAHTLKDGNNLHLKEYKYSYLSSNKENIVISGDGLFVKINDKFIPQYITCHTKGYAPISVTGSFGEKVSGGKFSGDLKYNYNKNSIEGTFNIIDAKYKEFSIKKAQVNAKDNVVNIVADGLYKGEKYLAEMSARNNFLGATLVYDMKLFLDKLLIDTSKDTNNKKEIKIDSNELSKKVQDADLTINNWEILINKIQREKFVLENVKLFGSLKNNIFDFNMDRLNFADGTVSANGIYDFGKNISKISFSADNINSNKASNMMLNLQDQIEGTANAKVKIFASDMFKFIDAHCIFEVKEGFLPKLGDAEFAIKNSKYKLSQIINYDLGKKDEMQFDIKGSFDVHNTELKNVDVISYSADSAMYLEGNYEMEKQYADLQLFWKYSKESPKGVRIFHIPLSFILKVVFRPEHTKNIYQSQLSKIPEINTSENNTNYYRVKLNGDINHNKVDFQLKEMK